MAKKVGMDLQDTRNKEINEKRMGYNKYIAHQKAGYEVTASLVGYMIEQLINRNEINSDVSISGRLKSFKSASENDPKKGLIDCFGIRIVAKTQQDLEKIQEAIAQMFEVELTRQHGTDGKERYDAKHQFIVLKKENISMIKKEPHEMPLVEVQYWTRELEKMCVGGELAYAKYKNKDLQGIFELYKKNPKAVFEQLPTCYEIKGRNVRQLEHEETLFKMYPELKKPEAEPEI